MSLDSDKLFVIDTFIAGSVCIVYQQTTDGRFHTRNHHSHTNTFTCTLILNWNYNIPISSSHHFIYRYTIRLLCQRSGEQFSRSLVPVLFCCCSCCRCYLWFVLSSLCTRHIYKWNRKLKNNSNIHLSTVDSCFFFHSVVNIKNSLNPKFQCNFGFDFIFLRFVVLIWLSSLNGITCLMSHCVNSRKKNMPKFNILIPTLTSDVIRSFYLYNGNVYTANKCLLSSIWLLWASARTRSICANSIQFQFPNNIYITIS